MIEFYATVSYGRLHRDMPRCVDGREVAYMLPASSWSNGGLCKPKLPLEITHTAADCGGYVATKIWGDYRYSPQQYVDWLETFTPQWAATMDFCCEKEVAANKGIVRERQQRTTDMAHLFWNDYRDAAWSWVPTVQGWQVTDYVRHAQELKPLILEMQAHYGANHAFRVGIGTLCKRASVSMVHEVVNAVARVLPGVPLHLWGIKLTALKSKTVLTQVVSVDSAAFDPGGLPGSKWAWEEQRKSGMSQRKYLFCVRLPQYLRKVHAALDEPKHMPLF